MLDSACTSHTTYNNNIVAQAIHLRNVYVMAYDQEFLETKIKLIDVLCKTNLRENFMVCTYLVRKGKCVIFDNEEAAIYEKIIGKKVLKEQFKILQLK